MRALRQFARIVASSSQGSVSMAQRPTAAIDITGDHELSTPSRHFIRFQAFETAARNVGWLIQSLPRYSNTNWVSLGVSALIASALNPSLAASRSCSRQLLSCALIKKNPKRFPFSVSNPSRARKAVLACSKLWLSLCSTAAKSLSLSGTVMTMAMPRAVRLSRREKFTALSNDANDGDQDDC